MESVQIPIYYLLGRKAAEDRARHILNITPCISTVISNRADFDLATSFTDEVLWSDEPKSIEDAAKERAITTGRPVLIINDTDELIAVYEDGRRELCL